MKRFTETTKWSDPWFRALTPTLKCLWGYLTDNCDSSGVIDIDFDLASFQIGSAVSPSDVKHFTGRLHRLDSGKYLILGFISFQYGKLSRACKPHNQIFENIERHGIEETLLKGYGKAFQSLQEKDTEKEREKEKDSVGEVSGGDGDLPPGLPPRFPRTLKAAINGAATVGVTEEFIKTEWEKAVGRGGKDHNEVPIASWPHYIATAKKYASGREAERKALSSPANHRAEKVAREYPEVIEARVVRFDQ